MLQGLRSFSPQLWEQLLERDFLCDDWDENLGPVSSEQTLTRLQVLWDEAQNINFTARTLGKEGHDIYDVVDAFNFLNQTRQRFTRMYVIDYLAIPFIFVDRRLIPWDFPALPQQPTRAP